MTVPEIYKQKIYECDECDSVSSVSELISRTKRMQYFLRSVLLFVVIEIVNL